MLLYINMFTIDFLHTAVAASKCSGSVIDTLTSNLAISRRSISEKASAAYVGDPRSNANTTIF